MKKNKIFISYAHNDQAFAQFLSRELNKHGFDTWSDDSIKPGEDWENEMVDALHAANLFVPLVSDQYIKSEFALVELGGAFGLGKNIVPIMLSDNIVNLPFPLRNVQAVYALKMDMATLVKSIENAAVRVAA